MFTLEKTMGRGGHLAQQGQKIPTQDKEKKGKRASLANRPRDWE